MQYTTPSRYEDIGRNRGGTGQERVPLTGIKRGPLAFMSVGTCLMIVWMVMLLPGQDIAAWQRQQQLIPTVNNYADFIVYHPNLAPQTIVTVPRMGRNGLYHWRADCPLLSTSWRRSHPFLPTMTLAQAQRDHFYPCTFCSRLEHKDSTSDP